MTGNCPKRLKFEVVINFEPDKICVLEMDQEAVTSNIGTR